MDIFRAAEKSNTRLYIYYMLKRTVWMAEWPKAHRLQCPLVMVVCGSILGVDD